jgi:hypothetical protein
MRNLKQTELIKSTSSPEDILANLSPSQVAKKVSKIRDMSGQKCLDLSKNSDLLGSLEKTLVDTLNSVSTPYSRTWRVKATPQGRLVFQLLASAPTTKEKESGLWLKKQYQTNRKGRTNSGRSVGGKQSPRNSKSIGRWSFETPEWSTDTDQIARSSEGAEIMADSDEMQRQLLRGQQSKQREETFEGTGERSGTQNDFSDSESIVSDGGEYREHSEKRKAEGQTRREGCLLADSESIKSWEQTEREGWENSSRGSSNSRRHSQERTKYVTDANSSRLEEQRRSFTTEQENQASQCGRWWDIEPDVGRVAHGVPKRVDRLKCLGNSVVPQIPFVIGLAIKETIENE